METSLLIMIVVCVGIASGTGMMFILGDAISPMNQKSKQGGTIVCPQDMVMVNTECIKVNLDNKFNLTPDILREQGFTGYRIVQILNCDVTDTDRGIRANRVANDTHVFDKINCDWISLDEFDRTWGGPGNRHPAFLGYDIPEICTEDMIKHLVKHSTMFDRSAPYYSLEWIGLGNSIDPDDFDACVKELLERNPKELENEN